MIYIIFTQGLKFFYIISARRNYFYAYGWLHLREGDNEEWCVIIKQMSGNYNSINRAAMTFAVQLSSRFIATHSVSLCVTKF